MSSNSRDRIELLKETIRRKRLHLGLPPEGKIDIRTVVESLKEKPPMEEIVAFVKNALSEDNPRLRSEDSSASPGKGFDRLA